MFRLLKIIAGFSLALCWCASAFAGIEFLSEAEFSRLAGELAPKVNLFHDTWRENPEAEFYGGTTRDYLYWLKGQFREAGDRGQAMAIYKKLQDLPVIDVREFIIGDSDVDIISSSKLSLRAEAYGVRKIDYQPFDILDPKTELGQNERAQGYIPAEKIRLAKDGLKKTDLGDGVKEIYRGKLSVTFSSPEEFAKSKYAKDGINHPILLAIRYLRLQGINYFKTHGASFPEKEKLMAAMADGAEAAVKKVIRDASDPQVLRPYLAREQFLSWLNGGIQKSFRSYTNPTAALELMKEFGLMQFPDIYAGKVLPINQYVFKKFEDPKKRAQALKKFGIDPDKFFSSPGSLFTDGKLYHGTKTEEAFRGILYQGVLPSDRGSAGAGLYGVSEKYKSFSENWGGDKDRLLRFEVDPKARVVDLTESYGWSIWEKAKAIHQGDYEKFADLFGIDILRYPYSGADGKVDAYVVKNASVLGKPEGVYRSVMSLGKILERAATIKNAEEMVKLLAVNQLSESEGALAWKTSLVAEEDVVELVKKGDLDTRSIHAIFGNTHWLHRPKILEAAGGLVNKLETPVLKELVLRYLPSIGENTASRLFAESVLRHPRHQPPSDLYGTIFYYLRKYDLQSPAAVDAYISYMEKRVLEKDSIKEALDEPFLRNNEGMILYQQDFNEEQAGKWWKFFHRRGAKKSHPPSDWVRPLVRRKYREKEAQALLWAEHRAKAGGSWEALCQLAEYFPDDPEVMPAMHAYVKEKLPVMYSGQPRSLALSLERIDNPAKPDLKAILMEGLLGDDPKIRAVAIGNLDDFSLNDHELALHIDAITDHSPMSRKAEHLFRKYHSNLGPEGARAFFKAALYADLEGRYGFPVEMEKMLHGVPTELRSTWRAQFQEYLSGAGAIDFTKSSSEVDHFDNAVRMLNSGLMEPEPAFLKLADRLAPKDSWDSRRAILNKLKNSGSGRKAGCAGGYAGLVR